VGPIDPHNLKATTSNFTLMVNCEEPIMGPTKNSSKQSHNVNYYVTLLSFYAIPLYNNTVKYMFAFCNIQPILYCFVSESNGNEHPFMKQWCHHAGGLQPKKSEKTEF
jgi:hypothetical protein